MKARFNETQIVSLLQEADAYQGTLSAFFREKNISQGTYYLWKRKYRGMDRESIKEAKELERENHRLKKLLAERDLDVEVLKEALRKKS